MWPFAAGNEFVTIILALIPLAVFLLSNLFKASQKPPKPAANPNIPKAQNGAGLPGTVDLDSFLREAKKRKAQQQPATPIPPPPRPVISEPVPRPQVRVPKPTPIQTPRPNRIEKRRENPVPTSRPKVETKASSPPPLITTQQGMVSVVSTVVEPPRPKMPVKFQSAPTQSAVVLALELIRSGKAAPTSFVLQEIFGPPRCILPYHIPGASGESGNIPASF